MELLSLKLKVDLQPSDTEQIIADAITIWTEYFGAARISGTQRLKIRFDKGSRFAKKRLQTNTEKSFLDDRRNAVGKGSSSAISRSTEDVLKHAISRS
eukprot:8912757-Pyramimonas_sp.AAC.1